MGSKATFEYIAAPEALDAFEDALKRRDVRAIHTANRIYPWMFAESAKRIAPNRIAITFTPRDYMVPQVEPWRFEPPSDEPVIVGD